MSFSSENCMCLSVLKKVFVVSKSVQMLTVPHLMKCLEQSNDDHQHVRHADTASELHKTIFSPKGGDILCR